MIDSSSSIAAFTGIELRGMKIQLKFPSIASIVPQGEIGRFRLIVSPDFAILFTDVASYGDPGDVD